MMKGIPFFNRQRALNFMAAAYGRNEEGEVEFKTGTSEPDYTFKGKKYLTGRAIVSHFFP